MGGVPLELALVFGAPALAVAGAAAVAIPIAIHLLSRVRRTRVDWGAMRFVRLAYQRQRRRLRFERWLLLAVRCLLVVLAGLALAAPVLTGALARWGADAARFESTQRIAEALAKAAAQSGRAVRVWPAAPTATGQGVDPDFDSAGADALGNVQATPAPVDLGGTLARVARARSADVADGRSAGVVAVVSDWSRAAVTALSAGGAGDEGAAAATGAAAAFWLSPPDPGAANVQVAALSPRRPLVLRAGGADAPPAVVSARVTWPSPWRPPSCRPSRLTLRRSKPKPCAASRSLTGRRVRPAPRSPPSCRCPRRPAGYTPLPRSCRAPGTRCPTTTCATRWCWCGRP